VFSNARKAGATPAAGGLPTTGLVFDDEFDPSDPDQYRVAY